MSAILAKILNSTVGTSSLKALDTILKADNTTIANNAADRLFNSLKSSSTLVGSDDVMFKYNGGWGSKATGQAGFNSDITSKIASSFIQFGASGTVIIKCLFRNASSYGQDCYIRVLNASGGVVDTVEHDVEEGATVEISMNLNVTAGTKYKLVLAGTGGTDRADGEPMICGKTMVLGATISLTT